MTARSENFTAAAKRADSRGFNGCVKAGVRSNKGRKKCGRRRGILIKSAPHKGSRRKESARGPWFERRAAAARYIRGGAVRRAGKSGILKEKRAGRKICGRAKDGKGGCKP